VLVAGSTAVLASGVAVAASGRPGPAASRPRIVLYRPLPDLVRIGQRRIITGRVPGAPRRSRVALESARQSRWSVVTSAALRRGTFRLHWRVRADAATGPLRLRLVATRPGRQLAATRPFQSAVGPAPVYCKPPVPPAVDIPSGDGWISGGEYEQGGPFPGFYRCDGASYTITASRPSGAVAASQTVSALHSYTLVLPAGTYRLMSSAICRGSATVVAGRQTNANTYCDYP
jgi:hypothetical protein